jgi:glycosyltransferase involved in cell wall biosynthesis
MRTLHIALVAEPDAPLGSEAIKPGAALAFDIAEGLADYVREVGDLDVTLVAARGSQTRLPLISLDPDELPVRADPTDARIRLEALLCHFVLSGMLAPYDVVHMLTSAVTPIQLLAATGTPVVQTLLCPADDPGAMLPPRLTPHTLVRQAVVSVSARADSAETRQPVAAGVDLTRYVPHETPKEDYVLWSASAHAADHEMGAAIARALDLPLRTMGEAPSVPLLQHARVFLSLDALPYPWTAIWILRALACGTPVVGRRGAVLAAILDDPQLGIMVDGNAPDETERFVQAIGTVPHSARARASRRMRCLGLYGRRAMVAQYSEIYTELAKATRTNDGTA